MLQLGDNGHFEEIDDSISVNSSLTGGSAGGDQADIGRVDPTVDVLPSTEIGDPISDIVNPQSNDKENLNDKTGSKYLIDKNLKEQPKVGLKHVLNCDQRDKSDGGMGETLTKSSLDSK